MSGESSGAVVNRKKRVRTQRSLATIIFSWAPVKDAQPTDDLCVMNADGTDAHVIVETAGTFESHPIWN